MRQFTLAACALFIFNIGVAQAGPCNTAGKDAGAGPTPGYSGQTTGTGTASANNPQHPPTDTMNRATSDVAASSQDAQRQMQNQPTTAQQAQGSKPTGSVADQGC
jgi:hypothetical protein